MRILPFPLLLVPLLLLSCGQDPEEGVRGANRSPVVRAVSERSFVRDDSGPVRELRAALDFCELERVATLLPALVPSLGVEGDLLRARAEVLAGRGVEANRWIERARTAAPTDPRVWATAAEFHAAAGRLETARDEIRRGMDECGMTPELLRAQGIVMLCQQGGAQRGLELLERALHYDPELPFTDRPLGQANLLLGKRALAERRPKAGLEYARRSLEHDPRDPDARIFLADALTATGEYVFAVRVLEELVAEGSDRVGELASMYKKAAMMELLAHHRDPALEYFRLAREAGLSDDELGSGVQILADAAEEAMGAGIAAFEAGERDIARLRFEHSLRLDPELLLARSQLAVVLFQEREFLPAATHWRRVLETALAEDLELPAPVHIYLSKALFAAGEKDSARAVLEENLQREPEGEWAEETRELLAELL